MRKLTDGQKAVLETEATVFDKGQHRPVIVEIEGRVLRLRAKGLRDRYALNLSDLYVRALRQHHGH